MDPRDHVTELVAPTARIASAAEAATYLGGLATEDAAQAAMLQLMLDVATDEVDHWRSTAGWCFRQRTLRLDLADFDGQTYLPGGPSTITAATLDGTASTDYEVVERGDEKVVCVEREGDWSFTYTVGNAVIPPAAELAVLRLVASFWEKRSAVLDEDARRDVASMLSQYTVRTSWE